MDDACEFDYDCYSRVCSVRSLRLVVCVCCRALVVLYVLLSVACCGLAVVCLSVLAACRLLAVVRFSLLVGRGGRVVVC